MRKQRIVLSTRLEPEYAEALVKVAKRRGITVAQLLREFATNAELICEFLQSEKERRKDEVAMVTEQLSRQITDTIPKDMLPEWLGILSDALLEIAEIKRQKEEKGK